MGKYIILVMLETAEKFARDLAEKAGAIMLKNFTLGMTTEWKTDDSPLTATDKAINSLVIQSIQDEYPNHSIISEEGSLIVKESEYTWVCDPIDGTFPFSHGYPCFVFSLALTLQGKSILGVIYDPILKRMFVAQAGKGTTLNNNKIQVAKSTSLEKTLIEFVTWTGAKYELFPFYELLSKKGGSSSTLLSICYAAGLVSCGEFAAAIYPHKNPWDAAAVKIIVEEAGGKVTDLFGNDQRYDQEVKGFIASNGLIHDQLVDLVKTSLKAS